MISLFIPTKNRSCQLDLLLRSLELCPIFEPYVVYKIDESFKLGFDLLKTRFPNVKFIPEEESVVQSFHKFLSDLFYRDDLFALTTDDTVFFRNCGVTEDFVREQFADDNLWCFSLRLGENTVIQDYTIQSKQSFPSYLEEVEGFRKWFWKNGHPLENNYYPSGQDACIYRVSDYLELFKLKQFSSMRDIEGFLASQYRSFILREWMMSPKESCAVNIPANSMQEPFIANGFNSYSPEILEEKYVGGEVIDFEEIKKNNINGCHVPITYNYIKYNNFKNGV